MNFEELKKDLIEDEARVPHAYTDSLGYLTIGIGHLIDKRLGGKLDDAVIDLQFKLDVERVLREAETYPWFKTLSDARQNVILNLLFNLGKERWDKFVNTQAAIARGDIESAARGLEQSKWHAQVGKRAVRLVRQWRDNSFRS